MKASITKTMAIPPSCTSTLKQFMHSKYWTKTATKDFREVSKGLLQSKSAEVFVNAVAPLSEQQRAHIVDVIESALNRPTTLYQAEFDKTLPPWEMRVTVRCSK